MMKNKYDILRTCIACRIKQNKDNMVHICYKDEQIYINPNASYGRGAYICNNILCLEKALKKGAFERAFKKKINDNIKIDIKNQIKSILEE